MITFGSAQYRWNPEPDGGSGKSGWTCREVPGNGGSGDNLHFAESLGYGAARRNWQTLSISPALQ